MKAPRFDALASVVRRIAFPPGFVIALAVPAICAMMAWVFLLGNESSPLAYAAYAASAYLLTVLCLWVWRRFPRNGVRSLAARSVIAERAIADEGYRRRLFVSGGLAVDAAWAAANLVGGACFASVWLVTLGAYYLVFAVMRGVLLLRMRRADGQRRCEERGMERLCGVLLLLSTFVLSGIVCLVMRGEGTFEYEGVLIYAVALFAFYSLISAIVNYVRKRKHDDVLVVLNCRINLAIALVSIFALEVAMLAEFGTAADADLQFVMPIITGAAIAAVLVGMGICSIAAARTSPEKDR